MFGRDKISKERHGVKERIAFRVVFIFSFAFIILGTMLVALPSGVRREIDGELQVLANHMVQQTASLDTIKLSAFKWPSESFETAGSFYVVLDRGGEFVKGSSNLPSGTTYLSRELIPEDPNDPNATGATFETRSVSGQEVRVLHYPIIGEFEGEFGEQLLLTGYLQIGRLIGDYTSYRKLVKTVGLASLAALSGSVWLLAKSIPSLFDPLDKVIESVKQVNSVHDLSRRINVYEISNHDDEFRRLSVSFNELITRMDSLFKTQQRLLADVSHELRTPLTSVQGNVDLMRRMGSADSESLDAIESEAERMSRLVNDLLTLARADVGGLPIQHEHVDLDMVFLNAYEQVRLLDPKIRVVLKDLVQIEVIGDEDRLKQLMLNLMTNAVKYSSAGDTVTVELAEDEGDALLTISDSGIGISAEDLPHIFDRFYRVNLARTRARGGSGLGLAIVDSIVTAHGSTKHVTSVLGEGSTFIIRLPASRIYALSA